MKSQLAISKKGVRRGCLLSPLIFNLFIEFALQDNRKTCRAGVKIESETLYMLRCGDDIVLLAVEKKGLQEILNFMNDALNKSYNLKVNKKKKGDGVQQR